MKENKVSIVITAYNVEEYLEKAVMSAIQQGVKEVIIVEDCSTDNTKDVISELHKNLSSIVKVIYNEKNIGAGNARCINQIKFAVTNGGVFSMEKRSTAPGGNIYASDAFSQWESVGGGLPASVSFDLSSPDNKYYFGYSNAASPDLSMGSGVAVGDGVQIGRNVKIGDCISMNTLLAEDGTPRGVHIDSIDSWIGKNVNICQDVYITDGVVLEYLSGDFNLRGLSLDHEDNGSVIGNVGSDFTFYYGYLNGPAAMMGKYYAQTTINAEFSSINFDSSAGNKAISIMDGRLRISADDQLSITIGKNVTIPDNLKFSIADNILTITDGTKTWKLTAEA